MKKPPSNVSSDTSSGNKDAAAARKAPPVECIVIGGSAGAIEALLKILPPLPAQFSLPILVVVHLPPEEKSLLPDIFNARCRIAAKEAEDKETIRGGVVYFAPPNYHLLVEADHTLSISSEEPVLYSRPSIDVLFESAADAFGTGLLAVILTGASSDGAAGSKAVLAAGGTVWVQQPDHANASLMPRSTLEACPDAQPLAIAELAQAIEATGSLR